MTLPHIPIRVIAADPAEHQAFADVLNGQAGALALAGANERPIAVLVTPSGDAGTAGDLPAVVLGARAQMPDGAQVLAIPVRMVDVLEALEVLATSTSGLSAPRSYKDWTLDPGRLVARQADTRTITLTDTEARLLACLFDAQGAEVQREDLLQRVWGYRPGLDTHTLETHIYRLRKKIEADPGDPRIIVTTGDGYHFVA
jgi:hypothetical protein